MHSSLMSHNFILIQLYAFLLSLRVPLRPLDCLEIDCLISTCYIFSCCLCYWFLTRFHQFGKLLKPLHNFHPFKVLDLFFFFLVWDTVHLDVRCRWVTLQALPAMLLQAFRPCCLAWDETVWLSGLLMLQLQADCSSHCHWLCVSLFSSCWFPDLFGQKQMIFTSTFPLLLFPFVIFSYSHRQVWSEVFRTFHVPI